MPAQNVFVILNGQPTSGGGTSASAPLMAGYMAVVNEQVCLNNPSACTAGTYGVGFANPALYSIGATFNPSSNSTPYATSFHDIVALAGSGPAIPPGPGYDLSTGWGSPSCGLVDQLSCVTCSGSTAVAGAPGSSSCASFQSDPNNCSSCGHVCQTGLCVQGTCAQTVLATGASEPGDIVLDNSNVYYTDHEGTLIQKVGKDGSNLQQIGMAQGFNEVGVPSPLAIDSTSVYWPDLDGINKAPIAGGGPTVQLAKFGGDPADLVGGIASDGTSVYWNDATAVWKLPVGGGAKVQLASANGSTGLSIDATNVYWTNEGFTGPGAGGGPAADTVTKVPIAGSTVTTLATRPSQSPPIRLGIAADDTNIYFATQAGPIMSVPIGGGTATNLTGSTPTIAEAIAVDANFLYWTESHLNNIPHLTTGVYKVALSGANNVPVRISSNPAPEGIAVDGTSVYITTAESQVCSGCTDRVLRFGK